MPTIEQTVNLRSAFLKTGWAPVIAYGGSVLLYFIGFMIARHSYSNVNTLLDSVKWVTVGCPLLILAGYIMSYIGFKQAHRAFGITRAGDAFATLKIIFLIFTILSAISLIFSIVMISNASPSTIYVMQARNIAAVGIIIAAIYLITVVYTITALLIIREKMKTIANTTNIDSLEGAYVGARVIIYTLCTFFVTIIVTGLFGDKSGAWEYIIFALDFITLFMLLYAIVKWVRGWLGAATEVIRHDVEAEDYTQQQDNRSTDE
ncbi:MAG: hypothetical protein K2L73_01115 [Muribaculaceae bacterium]|nr:hypothetical protein [Muribaculaceae bacterium]